LQRYCANGHLDAQKIATTLGDKYLITPQSVARHIAQIEELRALDSVATDRDLPRQVATSVVREVAVLNAEKSAPTVDDTTMTRHDTSRLAATTTSDMSRYVEHLKEKSNKRKTNVISCVNKSIAKTKRSTS
jgi:hypothetical protein